MDKAGDQGKGAGAKVGAAAEGASVSNASRSPLTAYEKMRHTARLVAAAKQLIEAHDAGKNRTVIIESIRAELEALGVLP